MQIEEKHNDFDTTKYTYTDNCELPDGLRRTLKEIAAKEGYLSYDIISKRISTDGGNYMAVLYEVDIKGQARNGPKELNMFVKYIITAANVHVVDVAELYSRELFFYTDLIEIYNELECEAAVPPDERYKLVRAYRESNKEAIILQNLNREGFTTVYRMNVMPLKFAELSVRQLAKFHGLNVAIEHRRPEYFERHIRSLRHTIRFGDNFRDMLRKFYDISVSVLDGETKRRLDVKLPEFMESYPRYINGELTDFKCLCHGDYRMNNVLMKMKGNDISEVIPIDYQLLFYGSPIIDLIYFIYSATDREFRRNHMEYLKETYYNTMSNYLKYFDINLSTVYPKAVFEEEYRVCTDYGIQMMLFVGPFFFTHEGDVPDLDKCNLTDIQMNLDHRFQSRLQGTIDDFVEMGRL